MIQHEFMSAEPFPHLVMDGFAPEATLRAVAAGFDSVSADAWVRYDDVDERGKSACNRLEAMPVACRDFIAAFSGPTAAKLCAWLTGIDGLSPDESLYGGGLHMTQQFPASMPCGADGRPTALHARDLVTLVR